MSERISLHKKSSGGGSGEANTASNVGTSGVGVFKTKSGVNLRFKNIDAGSNKITVTDNTGNSTVDIDVDPANIDINALQNVTPLNTNMLAGTDNTGKLQSQPGFNINTGTGGLQFSNTVNPNGSGGNTITNFSTDYSPTADASTDSYNHFNLYAHVDPANSGFDLGDTGSAINMVNIGVDALGTGNLGNFNAFDAYFNIGNGTDAINSNGFAYAIGYANVNANVTVKGSIQGYLFQPSLNSSAIMDPNTSNITPFADFSNFPVAVRGYSSFYASPTIGTILNNTGWSGFQVNPNITTLQGNSSASGFGYFPSIGTNNTGYSSGFTASPNVTLNKGTIVGFNSYMGNVTNYAGVKAQRVVQDLTYVAKQVGTDYNTVSITYTSGGTAGSEAVSLAGNDITVQIDAGVSTAAQIKTAIEGNLGAALRVDVIISGTGSNAQSTQTQLFLLGGENAGQSRAADFNGDVTINGGLSFTGGLSVGALNAFRMLSLTNGGGQPSSAHTLISMPTAAANATTPNADYLGVNTAALITLGANSTTTTAFLGIAALGLPAVLSMGAGATVDRIAGSVFALSLDATATGGTADQVALCRAMALPNGITTVNRLYGYEVSLPFGSIATKQWGVYVTDSIDNFMAGSLRIGGTTISDDDSLAGVALHVGGKAFFESDLGFFGTTPVAQQVSSGAATAGGTYSATEQTMIQEMYNALRAYGLLT